MIGGHLEQRHLEVAAQSDKTPVSSEDRSHVLTEGTNVHPGVKIGGHLVRKPTADSSAAGSQSDKPAVSSWDRSRDRTISPILSTVDAHSDSAAASLRGSATAAPISVAPHSVKGAATSPPTNGLVPALGGSDTVGPRLATAGTKGYARPPSAERPSETAVVDENAHAPRNARPSGCGAAAGPLCGVTPGPGEGESAKSNDYTLRWVTVHRGRGRGAQGRLSALTEPRTLGHPAAPAPRGGVRSGCKHPAAGKCAWGGAAETRRSPALAAARRAPLAARRPGF